MDTFGRLPPSNVGIAPGEEPNEVFPAGTVYLANWADDDASVWEWDLARAVLRRRIKLPLPAGQGDMRLLRTSKALHLLTHQYDGLAYYTRMPLDLGSSESSRVGRFSSVDEATLVADDTMAAVFFNGEVPRGGNGFWAATYDEKGQRISRRRLLDHDVASLHSALFRSHLFTLVPAPADDEEERFVLLRLGRDLSVETRSFVPLKGLRIDSPDYIRPALFVSHGRLFGGVDGNRSILELSPEGRVLSVLKACERPLRHPSEPETWVGHVHVIAHSSSYVEWSDSDTEPPPAPCPDFP